MRYWNAFWRGYWDRMTLGFFRRWYSDRFLFGWRWHFRMSRLGQVLLRIAHKDWMPRKGHDLIERLVYGKHG